MQPQDIVLLALAEITVEIALSANYSFSNILRTGVN